MLVKFKFLPLMLVLLLSTFVQAKEEKVQPPLDPSYMGVHNLILVNGGYTIYASNIPTYSKPGNVQLVYKLKAVEPSLIYMVRDADLVTVKTEPFNIERLMRGERVTIKLDVYMGHYDKGGVLTYKGMPVEFEKQLYSREITKESLQPSSSQHKYDSIILDSKERLLVHQIQLPPSYDQLILFYQNVSCITDITASSAVPSEGELLSKLTMCGAMKPLYYSTDHYK